jgi:hypothetical protein
MIIKIQKEKEHKKMSVCFWRERERERVFFEDGDVFLRNDGMEYCNT